MFSLIITLISIALVAALALATMYYGGDLFNEGNASARAAQVMNQGQQLLASADAFYVEHGRWPDSTAELVSKGFLKEVPTVVAQGPADAVNTAVNALVPPVQAAALTWTMPSPNHPTFVLDAGVNLETCKAVNFKWRGDNGVLPKLYTTLGAQCYGASTGELKVVVTKDSAGLATRMPIAEIAAGPLPDHGTPAGWLSAPSAVGTSVGSGGAGGGSGQPAVPPVDTSGIVTLSGQNGGSFGALPEANKEYRLAFTVSNGTAERIFMDYAQISGDGVVPDSSTCEVATVASAPLDSMYGAVADFLLPDAYAPVMSGSSFTGGPWTVGAGASCTFTVKVQGNLLENTISNMLRIGLSSGDQLTHAISGTQPVRGAFSASNLVITPVTVDNNGSPANTTNVSVTLTNQSAYTLSGINVDYVPASYNYKSSFNGSTWYGSYDNTCAGPVSPGASVTCSVTFPFEYAGGVHLNASAKDGSTGPVYLSLYQLP